MSQSLIQSIPPEKQGKRGWTVTLNGNVVPEVTRLAIAHPRYGEVNYGLTPPGYDGWSFAEIGGGGSVIVPYATIDGHLHVGVVEETRHNQGGTVLNVPRGFLDPGETHFEAAARELGEEMGLVPGKGDLLLLPGSATNCNSAFFETPNGEGVKFYALKLDPRLLEQRDGNRRFKEGVLTAKKDAAGKATAAEKIFGACFIHWTDALELADMFTVAGVGRLRGHLAKQQIAAKAKK